MTLAVTAMVRDEADIIRQWVEYHVAQGVDVIIVTDNASTDGTTEILQGFADAGVLHLHHDPVHRKQQGAVVTAMAREAATRHGADWVVNADADEFLVPVDRSLRLADVFAALDPAIAAFTVPVVNLVGPLAERGAGIDRLVWRDGRSNEQLQQIGVLAQPTPNAVHVGDPEVTVAQGNHLVSIANAGEVPEPLALEVLHLPWRSWEQMRRKVESAGRGYEANPDLRPSPNHHGMLDYARLTDGVLLPYVAARHVTSDEAVAGPFVRDDTLPSFLAEHGLGTPAPDVPFDEEHARHLAAAGRRLVARDRDVARLGLALEEERRVADDRRRAAHDRAEALLRRQAELEAEVARLTATADAFANRRIVRTVDAVAARLRQR